MLPKKKKKKDDRLREENKKNPTIKSASLIVGVSVAFRCIDWRHSTAYLMCVYL